MKIVADGEMLEALLRRFDGEPLQAASHVCSDTTLLVWAHASADGTGRAFEYGGLLRLQRILSDNRSCVERLFVAGFLPQDQYGDYSYLLEGGCYQQLPGWDFPAIQDWYVVSNALRAKAAEREIEKICARIRHLFDDAARPAARIALGAYACGDVPHEGLVSTLQQLRRWPAAAWENVLRDLKELADLQPVFRPPFREGIVLPEIEGKILLIEDQEIARQSWQGVLDLVFDGWARKGATKALKIAVDPHAYSGVAGWDPEGLSSLDLVLLDYELKGKNGTTLGGNLIHGLKNAAFDLPIIIFTASDEASVTTWCLRNGASDYFVKELPERDDRQSIQHYRTLKKVLGRQLEISRPAAQFHSVRSLYREYVLHGASAAQQIDRQQKRDWKEAIAYGERRSWNSVDFHFRQAFRFLLSDRFWAERAMGATPAWNQAYFHAYNASEAVAEACRARAIVASKMPIQWTTPGNQLDNRLADHNIIPWRDLSAKAPKEELLSKHFPKGRQHESTRLPQDKVLHCLAFSLMFAELAARRLTADGVSKCMPAQLPRCPRRFGPAPFPPQYAGAGTHFAESELAAIEYAQQAEHYVAHGNVLQLRPQDRVRKLDLLFVDDRIGTDDRWADILKKYLGFSNVAVRGLNPTQIPVDGTFLRGFDVVLLDMRLPSERRGIWTLAEFKKRVPDVPVVMFTSSYSSRSVRMALAAGAADYFLTRGGLAVGNRSRHEELLDVIAGLENHWRGGRLRLAYQRIVDLEHKFSEKAPGSKRHFVPNLLQALRIAWAYLSWAEYGYKHGRLRPAWNNWVIEGHGTVYKQDGDGNPYPERIDGCYTSFLLQCGLVGEGLQWAEMQDSPDLKRVRRARNDAVHSKNSREYQHFPQLCDHLHATISLVESFLRGGHLAEIAGADRSA